MKHSIRAFLFTSLMLFSVVPVHAQQLSILPVTQKTAEECVGVIQNFEITGDIVLEQKLAKDYASSKQAADDAYKAYDEETDPEKQKQKYEEYEKKAAEANQAQTKAGVSDASDPTKLATQNDILGCAIKTGRVSLVMIPYFITYISNFLLSIIGLISMLFIVLGGYQYVAGGLTEQKEKGKQYIYHALMGMGIAIMAWVIVNMVITIITS
ncbi:hypothetical protein IT413_01800 [Candidatus Peregrinibacteria bacterium]|nr:hypothetical protein [Candidatus Peregrinibacteria bacterium]